MAAKKPQKKAKNGTKGGSILKELDIFKKAYDTATGIVEKTVDIIQKRINEIIYETEKKVFFFAVMALAGLFLLFAISEFISSILPWFGKTSGYLIVAIVLAGVGFIFKKGMD
ncbi:MAG: hypothetical protein KAS15_02315 [Nanoarchaeota archaeon]|nr:hypothetical protein [Nanoarchaeota archaeon]MCK5630087.1 hypothetical protein [Nanoarchaeota archaeon]